MFSSFFEQDHLLNVFTSAVYAERRSKCAYISIKNCSPKSDRWFFFLTLTVRGSMHRKNFEWKKYGGTGLILEKNGSFVCRT